MSLSPYQEAVVFVAMFTIGTVLGIVFVAIPDDPPWLLYFYVIVNAVAAVYFLIKVMRTRP